MQTTLKAMYKRLPLFIAISVLWIAIFIPLNSSMNLNDGNIIYTLDDAYIHMAIAKHFAEDGVFGITKYKFTPSSSSPLWTLLLSFLYYLFGVSEITPFLMNFFFASSLIIILSFFLEHKGFSLISNTLILFAFIFFIPLPYLVLTGLEHILQIIISLILIITLIDSISRKDTHRLSINKFPLYIYITSFLLVSTRYEGLFLIGAISLFLLIRKEFLKSFLILISGALPVIIYGTISLSKGWYFIPNSILLKGKSFNPSSIKSILMFLYNGLRQTIYNIHILVILISIFFLLLIIIRKYKATISKYTLASHFFIIVTLMHFLFAKTGLFLSINYQLRYDSYLIALGFISILSMPLPNWYENILLNDIGGINFLTDIKCLDILGLSSKEPANLFLKKQMNTKNIEKLANSFNAKIAIVNNTILNIYGGVPKSWYLIGQWKIKKSVISPLDTISFYALSKTEIKKLRNSLKEFSKTLPKTLFFRVLNLKKGIYLENNV